MPSFFKLASTARRVLATRFSVIHLQAAPHARMQRNVRNANLAAFVLEAKHQEPSSGAKRRRAPRTTDSRRTRHRRRGFAASVCGAATTPRTRGERAADRGLGGIKRGAAHGQGNLADLQLSGIELFSFENRNVSQGQTANPCMPSSAPRSPMTIGRQIARTAGSSAALSRSPADAARVAGG